jgi:CheY-like chemotaxis protein
MTATADHPVRRAMRRVLVVEDHLESARALGELVVLWGHASAVVSSGEAALAAVEAFAPTAVLVDLGLPGMRGGELADRLRAGRGGDRLLLVALSGCDADDADVGRFDHHMRKPIDLAVLERWLAEPRRRTRKETP